MEDTVLPNTSLCAIVRDEKINPAGGIVRFIKSVMPHVEQAVVLDTGSVDGTRELLEEARIQFPNLRVYDAKFEGYAEARNQALKHVQTEYALVLDCDEIIQQKDFPTIAKMLDEHKSSGYKFKIMNIDLKRIEHIMGHPGRLFKVAGHFFHNYRSWFAEFVSGTDTFPSLPIEILHFQPSEAAVSAKWYRWYNTPAPSRSMSPSKVSGFSDWKTFNPRRDNYIASNLDTPIIEVQTEAVPPLTQIGKAF